MRNAFQFTIGECIKIAVEIEVIAQLWLADNNFAAIVNIEIGTVMQLGQLLDITRTRLPDQRRLVTAIITNVIQGIAFGPYRLVGITTVRYFNCFSGAGPGFKCSNLRLKFFIQPGFIFEPHLPDIFAEHPVEAAVNKEWQNIITVFLDELLELLFAITFCHEAHKVHAIQIPRCAGGPGRDWQVDL